MRCFISWLWLSLVKYRGLLEASIYNDVIMSAVASQTTSLAIVYSTVYSGADQRKHQTPRHWPLCAEWPVTQKMYPFHDVIMLLGYLIAYYFTINKSSIHNRQNLQQCPVLSIKSGRSSNVAGYLIGMFATFLVTDSITKICPTLKFVFTLYTYIAMASFRTHVPIISCD